MNPGWSYTFANAVDNTTVRRYSGEYFELLSDVRTSQYSEVWWQSKAQPLPADIVARFADKIMVITGYEADIVRGDSLDNVTSAPCYEQYNHHYSAFMSGKYANQLTGVSSGVDGKTILGGHGEPIPMWQVAPGPIVDGTEVPSVQVFSEGNGNEHRGSWHGYAKGYGQLIYSPTTWTNSPMIINTNKRLTTGDDSPGPINHKLVPKSVLSPPNSDYSGIMECPCTTRINKVLDAYEVQQAGSAPTGTAAVLTATECAAAGLVTNLVPAKTSAQTVTDASKPSGCIATPQRNSAGAVSWNLLFNNATNSPSVVCGGAPGSQALAGALSSTIGVTIGLSLNTTTATISLSAPTQGDWFGVAFNATTMADTPYAIIVDGKGAVQEYRLGNQAAGSLLKPSISVSSASTSAGITTVTVTRPLSGMTSQHYTFDLDTLTIPVLAAQGKTSSLSYHGPSRTAANLTITAPTSAVCLRRDGSSNKGTIANRPFNPGKCAPYPISELWTTHNAICNISEYGGGLMCCGGGTFLLDADQEVPEPVDEWRMRYRFYFEEYNGTIDTITRPLDDTNAVDGAPQGQKNLFRVWWSTEAYNNEYDVPKSEWDCLDPTTPVENCTHQLTSRFTGRDLVAGPSACMLGGDAKTAGCANITKIEEQGGEYLLMYAAAHCHTPACESLELWNDDTGELLCRNEPVYGSGNAAHNESAYVVGIPPCVWGSADEGLVPPPRIHLNSNLSCVKRNNNTNGHWGTMALWQARGAYVN